jgi:hypothetical protein
LQGILREHFATIRDQKGLEDLTPILLHRLDFALFKSCDSPAIEGLVFCRMGAMRM